MTNWQEINKLQSKFFTVTVYKSECNIIEKFDETFDFILIFNSSEERTLEYAKLFNKNSIKNSLLVDFDNEYSSLKESNFSKNYEILEFISQNKPNVLKELDIFSYEESIEKIIDFLPQDNLNINSKCFIEITGVPLIYSTTLFKMLKQKFPNPNLYLLNVSANYENGPNSKYQFSEGERENIYIPGYYGRPDFSKPWLYIFLLGFEGNRSLSILKQNQPDFSEAIIAEPGYQKDYSSSAIEINKSFFIESNISTDEILKVDAGDPVALCNKIIELYDKYKDTNICLVPLGTKPHAIGAGLAAIIKDEISIMYQVPKKYSMNGTKSGKYIWMYKII